MAILEVHDGRGQVNRVELTRDEPFIFGSSPACTIVINDPAAFAVHGRIRWQRRKFKIDAGADVAALEINGKKLKSSTLYQGDEIRIGASRIFVITTEDNTTAPADDKTRVQAAPKAIGKSSPRPVTAFDSPQFDAILDDDEPQSKHKKSPRKAREKSDLASADDRPVTKKYKPNLWTKLKTRVVSSKDAPGEERVISSPIVVGMIAALLILGLASFGLWKVVVKASALKQYTKAFESLDNGDYRNAIKELEQFILAYPDDSRSGKARVFRAMANVRQYTTNTSNSWQRGYQAAQEMISEVREYPEYRDASTELAEQLIKITEGLADQAKAGANPETLREAESAKTLFQQVAGEASENLLGRSRVAIKMADAGAAIKKAATKAAGMAAINKALAAGSPGAVYDARDILVAAYPDLAKDRDLVAGLIKANDLIRKAVAYDSSQRPAETIPHTERLGPPTTLVLRDEPGRPAANTGSVVYAIADGLAYGIESTSGTPLWQVPVGLSSPFQPMAITGGEASVLLIDARYDELVRLDGKTGKLIWRQEVGERLLDAPLILGNQVIASTPSGKLLFIDLGSGALRGTLNLGRPLTRSPISDETGLRLYVLAQEDCLFIIDRDPPGCVAVEYLGHNEGSIPCSPARVGRFLVFAENTSLENGLLKVYLLDEKGEKPTLKQSIPVAGWVWSTPASAGSVLWSTSDRGEIVAYSLGLYDDPEPLKPVARLKADNEASGPTFGIARSERELWLAGGRSSRIDLNTETGKLAITWNVSPSGPSVAPVQLSEKLAIFTQQSQGEPGVALVAADPQNGSVRWRTTLGAAWPIPLKSGPEVGSFATVGFDGKALLIPASKIDAGGFLEQPLFKPGTFRLPSIGAQSFTCGAYQVLIISPKGSQLLVRKGEEPVRAIDLPAPLGATPLAWGDDILVPGGDGRLYLIDPATGDFASDPFVPRFDKANPTHWRTPVLIEGDAVVISDQDGYVRRLIKAIKPRPRLQVTAETKLGKPLSAELASTGGSVVAATLDGKIRSLSARDLSPASSVDLTSARTIGPIVVGKMAFVGDASGQVLTFVNDGRRLWQTKLRSPMTDAPAVLQNAVWFLTKSGTFESRNLADGAWIERVAIAVLPAGPPIASGDRLAIPSGLGSIRPVNLGKAPTSTTSGDALK